ncbi:MAG: AAA family ATPase, partial [Methylobacter tundripaludum]|nr:AAA family ATPase [Methylobacter tundripaludum]
ELYALTGNPSKLIELIDSQFDKQAWIEEKEQLINKWLADRANERTLIKAISEESNLKAQLNSTNDKILLYENSNYKEILNQFNKSNSANNFFADSSLSVVQFISKLENLEKAVPKIENAEELNDVIVGETSEFLKSMNTALETAKEKISEAIALVSPYKEDLSAQFNALPWLAQFEEAKQNYGSIVGKIQELGNETYETLIQRSGSLTVKLALNEKQKLELFILQQDLEELYASIIEKEKELRIKRAEIINRWKEFDQSEKPFLIIELHPMADAESANASFRKLLRKEGGEFSSYIYSYNDETEKGSGLIADIIDASEEIRWIKRDNNIKKFVSSSEVDTKGLDLRLAKHIDSLKANTPEDIDRLMVWVAEDKLVLKFKKQGKEEDIQTGSAGERTAGMLGLLLALNNIPLAIDQPEDDLDSRLISSFVVPGFKTLKQTRQLILVTHNPNIAVNANSDNMVHMNFTSGQIIVEGNDALQNKDIRLAVCDVMEGGREALNKRYFRISKALK